MNSQLVKMLFDTKAFRVCEQDNPFWYTSNKIGPYYVNTHFLYGSEQKANELLKVIDEVSKDRENCSKIIYDLTAKNYAEDKIYKTLIDLMVGYIKTNVNLDQIDYISGGERRDWFFSLIIADLLDKPHLTIFKDLSIVKFTSKPSICMPEAENVKVLHVADIITEASSYARAWVPAIKNFGGIITDSLVVIDRLQGGGEVLAGLNVKSHALANIDMAIIESAKNQGLINQNQFDLVSNFIKDPYASMRNFLIAHPDFLEQALNKDEKTAMRAKICIEQNLYNL